MQKGCETPMSLSETTEGYPSAKEELELLKRSVSMLESEFNPELNLLRVKYHTNGYHTMLTGVEYVHSTRASVEYALALLDTGLPEYEAKAFKIIEQIISLQDCDPSRDTYGIWSYYYEEPLDKMAPPDWNWADFIGKVLVMIAIRHGERLPEMLAGRLQEAVFHACESIIRRNMGPHYTNIAIMGSFVAIAAGEQFGHRGYLEYGLGKFEAFHAYTRRLNTFQEYNSPTYTVVAIIELSKIRSYCRSPRAIAIADEMLRLAWTMAGEHYHAATGQWSGPHSRCYHTLLTDATHAFLRRCLGKEWTELAADYPVHLLEWHRSGASCPDDLRSLFQEPADRELREIYYRGEDGYEKTGTTWMTPSYSVGSASKEVMWNQRRNLLIYMDNGGKPAYASLRMLHDGYDFSAPVLTAVQDKGHVLCGMQFSINGGDTHIGLDRINGSIQAEDLRLRLEFGGALEGMELNAAQEHVVLTIGGTRVSLSLLSLVFDGDVPKVEPKWTVTREGDKLALDLLLYSGSRRLIDFAGMRRAGICFAVSAEAAEAATAHNLAGMEASADDTDLRADWSPAGRRLSLKLPLKPDRVETLRGQQ
ncbi:hypothetical protein B1748_00200 [Paenibacillus sp. MY03]|nr:hypothetical protein B1748_00200 [Paenibacillus sp. MY03]